MAFTLISFWWDLLICIVILSYLIRIWIRKKYSYWENLGMPGPHPKIVMDLLMRTKNLGLLYHDLYQKYGHIPYVGAYHVTEPALMVNDLELMKRILVKDFNHFTDHIMELNIDSNSLAAHLLNLKGEKWKSLRAKLSPTFTTSRMKQMFELLEDCTHSMMEYMENYTEEIMDVKELLAKFNTDVIGRCAFGIECNSFNDPDSKFREMGKKLFSEVSIRQILIMTGFTLFPNLFLKLKIDLIDPDVDKFFRKLVADTVEYRETNKIVRNDFLDLLIKLKNQGHIDDTDGASSEAGSITLSQLTAQVMVFFVAGFDTTSTTVGFALYELALNPEAQDTLAREIDRVLEAHGGRFTYDSLTDMTYLSQVIDETLRMHPPVPLLFRTCTQDYIIPETNIKIEKDRAIIMPLYAIQRDPQYYPDPNKFDPDRFSPENKASRHHFTHLPFGEGPRMCIGTRFGLMQSKLGMAMLLHKYEVSVCDKTQIPVKYNRQAFVLVCDGGVWLKIKKRVK